MPEAVNHSHMLLMIGRKIARNMFSWSLKVNKLSLLHLVGLLYYLPTSVAVHFTLGYVGLWFPFCCSVNLKVLSQGNLHWRSLQGPGSNIAADARIRYLVLEVCLYSIVSSSLSVYRNYVSDQNTFACVPTALANTISCRLLNRKFITRRPPK